MTTDARGVRGSFTQDTLVSTIQFAATADQPSRFEISSGLRRATAMFNNGNMIAAECFSNQRELLGEQAVVEFLSWRFGEFALTPDPDAINASKGRIDKPIMALLLSATTTRDTMDSSMRQDSSMIQEPVRPDAIPSLITNNSAANIQLDASSWVLIPKIDGSKMAGQIAQELGLDMTETGRRLRMLEQSGLIKLEVRLVPIPSDFLPNLTRFLVQLTGPMGDILLEDAAYAAKIDLGNMQANQAITLARFLEAEIPADRVVAFRQGMMTLLRQSNLS
jgi:Domain of unknown function (DUF4388)